MSNSLNDHDARRAALGGTACTLALALAGSLRAQTPCTSQPTQIFEWNGENYGNRRFVAADFNGDGRDDLIVTRAESGTAEARFTLSSSAGFGPFQDVFNWCGVYDYSNRGFLAADVDGDGREDLIVTRAEPGRAEAAYTLASPAGFQPFHQIFQWDGYDYSNRKFLAADVDGDGRDDLIVTRAEPGRAEAAYTLSTPAGFQPFEQVFQWDVYDYSNRGFLVADVNGDGRDDLIVTRAEPGRAEAGYTLSSPAGFQPFQQIFEWNGYDFSNRKFIAADVNGDGRDDLIVTRAEQGRAEAGYTLSSDTGFLPFQSIFEWNDYDYSNRGFLAADVNGDGRDDLVVTRAEPGRAEAAYTLALPEGFQPFERIFEWNDYDYSNRGFLVADVNGDGRDDLIVTRAEPGRAEAAHFTSCIETALSYCTAGLSTNLCQPTMVANGSPRVSESSGFVLTCTGVEGQRSGLIFYGTSGRQAEPWGSGSSSVLCVRPSVQRTSAMSSGGTAHLCDGSIAVDWLAFLAANPTAFGAPFSAGTLVQAQCWYRDPPAAKTTNLSNALEFVTVP